MFQGFIEDERLVTNPAPRVPVVLCLDRSGSMVGAPIAELNRGIKLFLDEVRSDPNAANCVELGIVSFACEPRVDLMFDTVENIGHFAIEDPGMSTNMAAGVEMALALLKGRTGQYQRAGVDYYRPWMILMTDGMPTTCCDRAARQTCQLEADRKLVVFPLAIGEYADEDTLSRFSRERPSLRLQGLKFREFFQWLSCSVSQVSRSQPGDQIQLDPSGIESWAAI